MTRRSTTARSGRMALQLAAVLLIVLGATGWQLRHRLAAREGLRIAQAFLREPGLPTGLQVGKRWDSEGLAPTRVAFDVASANQPAGSVAWEGFIVVDAWTRRVSSMKLDMKGKAPAWRAVPVTTFAPVGQAFAQQHAPEVFHGRGQLHSDFVKGNPPDYPNVCHFGRVDRGWEVPVRASIHVAMDGSTICGYDFEHEPYRVPEKVISEDKAISIARAVYQRDAGNSRGSGVSVSRVIFGSGSIPLARHAFYMVSLGGGYVAVPGGGTIFAPPFQVRIDAVTGRVLR